MEQAKSSETVKTYRHWFSRHRGYIRAWNVHNAENMSRWRPQVHSERCTKDTTISILNFKKYCNSSVISWSRRPRPLHSHPSTQRKTTCLFGFSGSVPTQL